MSPESYKRKLPAILSADVKGYSRLMGVDEVGTIRTLKNCRRVISDLQPIFQMNLPEGALREAIRRAIAKMGGMTSLSFE